MARSARCGLTGDALAYPDSAAITEGRSSGCCQDDSVKLVTVRVPEEEVERWKEEAWRRKLSLAAFIRQQVRLALSEDLRDPDGE